MSKAFTVEVDCYAETYEDYDRIVDEIMAIKGVDGTSGKQWAAISEDTEDET